MIDTTTQNTEINLNEVYVAYDVPIPQVMIREISPQSKAEDIQKKEIQKNKCCNCCCTDNKTNTSDEDVSTFILLWLYLNDISLCDCLSYCLCDGDCCDDD
jgi:hypothetical protein